MKAILFLFLFGASSLLAEVSIKAGSFKFIPTAPWVVQEPGSHMVKGALTHTAKGPLVKIYHFGEGQGGGIEANIKRWQKQFDGEVKVTPEEKNYGKQKVAIVTMDGTFLEGGIMQRNKTPRAGWTLLGAIIPHPSGDVFFKAAGPTAEIMKAKKDFETLIASAFLRQ